MPIRWFVSAYVWLTGFGNAVYFWRTNDFSLGRFLKMLWRINFFVVFLSLATGTHWIAYYVVALHTVHFVLCYVSLGCAKCFRGAARSMVGLAVYGVLCVVVWEGGLYHAAVGPVLEKLLGEGFEQRARGAGVAPSRFRGARPTSPVDALAEVRVRARPRRRVGGGPLARPTSPVDARRRRPARPAPPQVLLVPDAPRLPVVARGCGRGGPRAARDRRVAGRRRLEQSRRRGGLGLFSDWGHRGLGHASGARGLPRVPPAERKTICPLVLRTARPRDYPRGAPRRRRDPALGLSTRRPAASPRPRPRPQVPTLRRHALDPALRRGAERDV